MKNSERKLGLYNRHHGITTYCKENDIVLDLDADDWIVGNQVLNFLNHFFHNSPHIWLFYSNLISIGPRGITHKPLDFYPQ